MRRPRRNFSSTAEPSPKPPFSEGWKEQLALALALLLVAMAEQEMLGSMVMRRARRDLDWVGVWGEGRWSVSWWRGCFLGWWKEDRLLSGTVGAFLAAAGSVAALTTLAALAALVAVVPLTALRALTTVRATDEADDEATDVADDTALSMVPWALRER